MEPTKEMCDVGMIAFGNMWGKGNASVADCIRAALRSALALMPFPDPAAAANSRAQESASEPQTDEELVEEMRKAFNSAPSPKTAMSYALAAVRAYDGQRIAALNEDLTKETAK